MIQIMSDKENANARKTVIAIPSAAVSHLPQIMGLAGIREREPGSDAGYLVDHTSGTVMVIQPARYRGRIDSAIRLLQRKYQPGFHTALEEKLGVQV